GIRVLARTDFSKIRRSVFEEHPEWAYRTEKGDIVDYNGDVHACLNGAFQSEYMFKIISEAIERTGVDGIFFNMSGFIVRDYSYNYHGLCHCESCKSMFNERYGLELPKNQDPLSPVYQKYRMFQRECIAAHNKRLYDHIKAISPDIAVNGFDIARLESNTEYGRAQWVYSASSNTRQVRGAGDGATVPSNCSVDFIGFYLRHVAVSPAAQELRLWQDMANLGGLDYYLIGRLDNHEDRSGFERVRNVFHFHKKHENDLLGLKARAEALLIRTDAADTAEERGWIRALTENHILFDETRAGKLMDAPLEKYKVILLPGTAYLTLEMAEKLDNYAKGGGIVVAVGESSLWGFDYSRNSRPLLDCLGVKQILHTRSDMLSAMLKLDDTDKQVFSHFPDSELVAIGESFIYAEYDQKAKGWMKLIPPHPYGPPERCYYNLVSDIPGVTRHSWGKGAGVFIPWNPGALLLKEGYDNTMRFLKGVLLGICGLRDIAPGLHPTVEITVGEKEGKTVVQFVNASGHFANSFYDSLPIHGAQAEIAIDAPVSSVRCLTEEGKVAYEHKAGFLRIALEKLDMYEAVVIEHENDGGNL
ncbi:MAG: hypothetical protein ACOX8S_08275, partial [Christensenellales bacterium]